MSASFENGHGRRRRAATPLIAFVNLTDYGTNWAFVQHVLSMDTTIPNSTTRYRAVTDSTLQTAGYWLIIAAETATPRRCAGCRQRTLALLASVRAPAATFPAPPSDGRSQGYRSASSPGWSASWRLAARWFEMWQSTVWNGEESAFQLA